MLVEKIHTHLIKEEKSLAFAESCTGGALSSMITRLPDASQYFLGSLVTYSNQLKEEILGVSKESLRIHGAVSREVANEMLIGLMKRTGADFGVAVTGIAGPTGGTRKKPVGTVYIATGAKGKKPHVVCYTLEGDREDIIRASSEKALDQLLVHLVES